MGTASSVCNVLMDGWVCLFQSFSLLESQMVRSLASNIDSLLLPETAPSDTLGSYRLTKNGGASCFAPFQNLTFLKKMAAESLGTSPRTANSQPRTTMSLHCLLMMVSPRGDKTKNCEIMSGHKSTDRPLHSSPVILVHPSV